MTFWQRMIEISNAAARKTDFREFIQPLTGEASEGKWDYRVTVQRLTDGITKSIKVSGGWQIAENYARHLRRELGSAE